jgi:ABC-type nickel/cobalt efflux system permease component RcnA
MLSVLVLGLLLGLQHAVEADHLAAVASLGAQEDKLLGAARLGTAWGLGHGLTLLLVGGTVLVLGGQISPSMGLALEGVVGLMLVLLGADVLWRLWRRRVHFHIHSHGTATHFHAHSHAPSRDHARDPHLHRHPGTLPWRPLLVGMVHGMAGSAALTVFALGSATSLWQGFAYILTFAVGSVVGMVTLAIAISLPLRWSARSLTWAHNGLTAVLGLFTLTLGALLIQQSAHGLIIGEIPL